MSFVDTFIQMSVLFMLVIVGFVANKFKIMEEDFNRKFSALIINITAPFMILSSVMGKTLPQREDILPVLIAGTLALLFMVLISYPVQKILRVDKSEVGVYRFMLVFGNIAFIGFPVVGSLFGTEAIFYASVLTIPFNLLIFVVGVIFVTQGKNRASLNFRIFISPCLAATYTTIILVVLQYKTPQPIAQACYLVGSITIPGSLLIIGSSLAMIPIRNMLGTPRIYAMCVVKLLLIPMMLYGIFCISPLDKKYADVLTILCAMPIASYGTMFCLKYGVDSRTMAQGTFLSTLLSVISIPILSLVL